ncbi:hypothetical protein [Croceivirga radicis]|uniref:hypothetical protein n=1 Tax=Croceivirga radicis TaxID=1929488 RepID=UPI000255BB63|nr:hypothetical protein [Croceivirga radicis]
MKVLKTLTGRSLLLSACTALIFTACSDDDSEMMGMEDDDMQVGRRAQLYTTNNENGDITIFDLTNDSQVTLNTNSTAAEGIYYNAAEDLVVQASRSGLALEAYSEVSALTANTAVSVSLSANADLESPRELAVKGNTYVVADNGSNKLFVYTKSTAGFNLDTTVEVPFALWGITFKGDDLYAVVDKSSDLAVYYDFVANASTGAMAPNKRVTIEGIVRTHGLAYSGANDTMVMTDIGDAANTTDDGGFHIIKDFSTKFDALSDGDVLPMGMQTRVAGDATLMGNPIDVAYDSETDAVYISDIGTGKVLGFTNINTGGNLSPSFNKDLTSASSIFFSSDETDMDFGNGSTNFASTLFTTSTANGNITVYDLLTGAVKTVETTSTATEGIYYSALDDVVLQTSRSNLMVEAFTDFSNNMDAAMISPSAQSAADLNSPREIAVYGSKVVVADNGENKLFVYSYANGNFTMEGVYETGFPVWGIAFKGNDLLAVVDTTSDLAIYGDFFSNIADGTLTTTKRITVEGIVRTHGIAYSAADDVLVLTDIGDAANTTDDGGFQVTMNATAMLDAVENGGTLALANQLRVAGAATQMGNPIDVAYDHKTKTVYVAEIGNGKILGFTGALEATGDIAPALANDLEAAASLYLYNN